MVIRIICKLYMLVIIYWEVDGWLSVLIVFWRDGIVVCIFFCMCSIVNGKFKINKVVRFKCFLWFKIYYFGFVKELKSLSW